MTSFPDCRDVLRPVRPAARLATALAVAGLLAGLGGCASVRDKLPAMPSIGTLVTP